MTVREPPNPRATSLLFDVWLIMQLTSGLLDESLEGSRLSGDDFGLYSLLRVFGPATPTQVARWTGMRPTSVSAALKRMAGRGHSEQRPNPADGRSYLVGLTPTGVDAHLTAAEPFLDVMGRVTGGLAPDELEMRIWLQRLDAVLRAVSGMPERPYSLGTGRQATGAQLRYDGRPLTPAQEQLVRRYIDFVRTTPQEP